MQAITLIVYFTESSSKHTHTHTDTLSTKNPHANLSPTERLERLFMFLEAQFGSENLTPIAIPRLSTSPSAIKVEREAEEGSEVEQRELEALQQREVERLHKIGIPVPGVEITVDKMVAKVWLEDLEVECANRVFGDRVRAVVERAVEVTAPLWG